MSKQTVELFAKVVRLLFIVPIHCDWEKIDTRFRTRTHTQIHTGVRAFAHTPFRLFVDMHTNAEKNKLIAFTYTKASHLWAKSLRLFSIL